VLEVGPGTGALTEHLLRLPIRLVAVELDERCLALLRERFPESAFPQARFVHGDILEYDLAGYAQQVLEQTGKKLVVIGNLPYNISSPLLFRLFDTARLLSRAVLMVQRELAQRLVAPPGTKEYGILRLACWVVAEARLCFHVPAWAFQPAPEVTSTVVSLRFRPDAWSGDTFQRFRRFLQAAFGKRRKQLHNALEDYVASLLHRSAGEVLQKAGIAPERRAEELSPEELIGLYRLLEAERLDGCA
jgi:16S rRNA (adenine1518-N6/adenine1519-N6)-dimethyltransferase